jgi:hypothetical protein
LTWVCNVRGVVLTPLECGPAETSAMLGGSAQVVHDPGQAQADDPLMEAVVGRVFDGDRTALDEFVARLAAPLPPGTKLFLRGSAVSGESYESGAPFDAGGPGSSDLDVVVTGPGVMELFSDEGFYLPRVNSRPLCDADPTVAPALNGARAAAQALVHRPVSIQAMAEWFLDLREKAQGTPSVLLGQLPE